ncbi:MAG: DUF3783 domain-containing protein [Oscillospiraceae bacterium]|nr:DUF3783 domain-containing protein [Oscillospiraceae bacterium]
MKSHVIKSSAGTIIAYKQDENIDSIRRIADSLGIRLVRTEENRAGEAVGYLAGFGGFSSNGSSESADSGCLIFAELSSKQIDFVLSSLRKSGISIPFKAVVTASNQSWSLKKLISELSKEYDRLGG